MLASTGPLMQRWFSQTSPDRSPYRLYALSNVGSLLALLSYPFVFEPWLKLRQQVNSWSWLYIVYVAGAAWCAVQLLRKPASPELIRSNLNKDELASEVPASAPGIGKMLLWLGLAACGSAMLLATTNQLCIDVATVPFLWVLPLSLYLISFILCFDNPHWYDRRVFGLLLLVCFPAVCWVLNEGSDVAISDQIAVYSVVLFACCMTCHGELVQTRPHPQFLTLFYVLVSAGGAVGGVFVAIAAPEIFTGYFEYHTSLVACCVMTLVAWCVQRVWLRPQAPAFWIWFLTSSLQVLIMEHWLYSPQATSLDAIDHTVYFGVYAFIQLTGFALTSALERRTRALLWAWAVAVVLQGSWLTVYVARTFPDPVTTSAAKDTSGAGLFLLRVLPYAIIWASAILPALFAGGLLLKSRRLSPSVLQLCIRWGILIVCDRLLTVFLFEGKLASWHIASIVCTVAAAILMEWSAFEFRGPDRKSLGFWFWIPVITLLLLLSNRLSEIIKTEQRLAVHTSRNFYGVLRVIKKEGNDSEDSWTPAQYSLTHGQIQHGFQFIDEDWKRKPTTYYGENSGVGLAIRVCRKIGAAAGRTSLRVGVVGLGTGTIAAYGESGDVFRFYDINPDVLALSDTYFTYLKDSPAKTDVVIGDARIMMERQLALNEGQQFDVLAIDAFSSDAIPVHLLTSECGDIYRQHLRSGGVLAVHISNRFLDLEPITRGLAEHLNWKAIRIEDEDDPVSGVFTSTWILLTVDEAFANNSEVVAAQTVWEEGDRILHWTDDYSGLWQVLSF